MEEYFLCFFFFAEELDVVDDEDVECSIFVDDCLGVVFEYFLDE